MFFFFNDVTPKLPSDFKDEICEYNEPPEVSKKDEKRRSRKLNRFREFLVSHDFEAFRKAVRFAGYVPFADKRKSQDVERLYSAYAFLLEAIKTGFDKQVLLRAESVIGQRTLLSLLYVRDPSRYIDITSPKWLDRICNAFDLPLADNVYDQNMEVRRFYNKVCKEIRFLQEEIFISFLVEYLGLADRDTEYFVKFLESTYAMRVDESARYARTIRHFKRYGGVKFAKAASKVSPWQELKGRIRQGEIKYFSHISCDPIQAIDYYLEFRQGSEKRILIQSPAKSFPSIESLIDRLQTSARARKCLRHYTSISSLIYIVEGEALRLSRGDSFAMNDQLEWKNFGSRDMWRRTFLSSFSGLSEESAAMWGMYGRPTNEAVRISFSQEQVAEWIASLSASKLRLDISASDSAQRSPIVLDSGCCSLYLGDVMYGGDVTRGCKPDESYCFQSTVLKRKSLCKELGVEDIDKEPGITGWIKSSDWKYEDECRLIVRLNEKCAGIENLNNAQYVHVPIPVTILRHAEYTLGPCVPEKLRPIFAAKIRDVLKDPDIHIEDSRYKDNLRLK